MRMDLVSPMMDSVLHFLSLSLSPSVREENEKNAQVHSFRVYGYIYMSAIIHSQVMLTTSYMQGLAGE